MRYNFITTLDKDDPVVVYSRFYKRGVGYVSKLMQTELTESTTFPIEGTEYVGMQQEHLLDSYCHGDENMLATMFDFMFPCYEKLAGYDVHIGEMYSKKIEHSTTSITILTPERCNELVIDYIVRKSGRKYLPEEIRGAVDVSTNMKDKSVLFYVSTGSKAREQKEFGASVGTFIADVIDELRYASEIIYLSKANIL